MWIWINFSLLAFGSASLLSVDDNKRYTVSQTLVHSFTQRQLTSIWTHEIYFAVKKSRVNKTERQPYMCEFSVRSVHVEFHIFLCRLSLTLKAKPFTNNSNAVKNTQHLRTGRVCARSQFTYEFVFATFQQIFVLENFCDRIPKPKFTWAIHLAKFSTQFQTIHNRAADSDRKKLILFLF